MWHDLEARSTALSLLSIAITPRLRCVGNIRKQSTIDRCRKARAVIRKCCRIASPWVRFSGMVCLGRRLGWTRAILININTLKLHLGAVGDSMTSVGACPGGITAAGLVGRPVGLHF